MNKAADNYTGSNYDEFIALSKVQKTLRNELKPTPFTAEHIKQRGIISEDEYRAQQSLELKKIADEYYRNYITHKLNDINNLDFYNLFDAIEEKYKKNDKENRDKLDLVEKSKRGEIAKMLSADDNFKSMFEAKLITKLLPDYVERNYTGEDKEKALETLALFRGFTTYFKGYFKTRKNMFSGEGGASSICHRIVNVNASIFYDNLKTFMCIKEKAGDEIALIEEELTEKLDGWRLEHIFSRDYYNEVLAQKGIDYYNQICGDINKHMNLYCQQNKFKANIFKMMKIQKQIMGISEKAFEKYDYLGKGCKLLQNCVIHFLCSEVVSKLLCHRYAVILRTVCTALTSHNSCEIYTALTSFECLVRIQSIKIFPICHFSFLRNLFGVGRQLVLL